MLRTFATLTTAANATMRQLHDRMPVALKPNIWSRWLGDTVAATHLMRPAANDVLDLRLVNRAATSIPNNGYSLLDGPARNAAAENNPAQTVN